MTVAAVVGSACANDDPAASDATTSTAATASATETGDGGLTVTGISTRLDTVSGGNVLLAVDGTDDTADATFSIDDDVLDAVAVDDGPGTLGATDQRTLFLVDGFNDGSNELTVKVGDESTTVEVVSHPTAGPIFSGPHLPMPTCTTEDFDLGPAVDDDCFADTISAQRYYDAALELVDVPADGSVPDDARRGPDGQPTLVDVETGVINRGVYEIMMPVGTEWNGRLVYRFGGGCGVTYSQGFIMASAPEPAVFEAGYAVATSTLNTFQVTCNDVISAETALMVKEHFIETHGEVAVTIGEGGSGGAIQQLLITQNYPGILDAIAPTLPFPDAVSISGGVLDCALLNDYYRNDGADLSTDQRIAINGHMTTGTCDFWEETFAPAVNPTTCGFGDIVGSAAAAIPGLSDADYPRPPDDEIWNADTNPDGVRCTLQDGSVNLLAVDPDTGYAVRPWDNEGLQYGLAALNDGDLSVDEFLDLNAAIGSFDINGVIVDERSAIDEATAAVAYEGGRVLGDLQPHMLQVPTILVNIYTDPTGDIHDRFRMFVIEERLRLDGRQAPNVVLWTRSVPTGASLVDSLAGAISFGVDIITTLDEWATALRLESIESGAGADVDVDVDAIAAAVESTRPDNAVNACFEADGALIDSGADVYDGPGPCTDPFPAFGDPRIVAGSPNREDVVKCALQPVDDALAGDTYGVEFTDAQRSRLAEVFPTGVCNWTEPGVGAQAPTGTWTWFGD